MGCRFVIAMGAWSRILKKPSMCLVSLKSFYCARAGDADHKASEYQSNSRACGSSPCFGAAHRPSHLSWLGSAYCRPLARRSVNRPTASHTTEIDLAADEFLSDNPHRGGYHGMHVPGAESIWHSLFFLIMLVLYS